MANKYSKDMMVIFFFAVVAILFSLPVFENIGYWGIQDWDAFFARSSLSRDSILQYGQFPLWNPFAKGGMPHQAHPEINILSFSFLFELLFGVVRGNKISIVFHLFVGLVGMYLLARNFKLEKAAAVLTGFVFMLSSMYSLTLTVGMVAGYSLAYMPWALLFYFKANDDFRYTFAAAIVLIMMWFAGGIYQFILSALFMGFYSFLAVCFREYEFKKAAGVLGSIGFLTFFLGAVKFFPAIEFTSQYPRHSELYAGFSLESLTYGLLDRDQMLAAINDKSRIQGFLNGFSHNMDEVGMYVGILPLVFFLVGLIGRLKKFKVLALCFLLFLWLSLGFRSEPFSLWALLNKVPPFSIMRTAERFRYVFMLCFAIFAGLGFQATLNFISGKFSNKKWPHLISITLLLTVIVDLFMVNSPVFRDAFTIPPIEMPKNESFFQIGGLPSYDKNGIATPQSDPNYLSAGAAYPAYLANAGSVYFYESMPVPENALINISPYYRGEVFLEGTTGKASYSYWSPNRLIIDVDARGEGFLVVNQNFYKGWNVGNSLEAQPVKGLLAVKITPQIKKVELYYRPKSFIIGALVSLLTVLVMCGWFWKLQLKERQSD